MDSTSRPLFKDATARTIMWRRIDACSVEEATLVSNASGLRITGMVLAAMDGRPLRVDYRIECDEFCRTRCVYINQTFGAVHSVLRLERDQDARWLKDGSYDDALSGCTDVDLGISPSTNTLPIKRLKLAVGAINEIQAAWVRFPGLTVSPAHQSYRRLSAREYQYCNRDTGFTAKLTIDRDDLVTDYAGVWTRVAEASSVPETSGFADALVAPGPSPELGDAAAAFSWLVGGWSAEVRDFDADGRVRTGTGEWWFSWILEGRAFQDVFIVPARTQRSGRDRSAAHSEPPNNRYGTTVRWFDRASGKWRIVWVNPVSGAVNTLAGERVDDRIVLLGEQDGRRIRWTFDEIRPDSFIWRGESARGDSWTLDAEFRLKRIASHL